ncbi:MAG: bacterial transcriptional activator domain-containing protein [Acidimicrobiales bacterium]
MSSPTPSTSGNGTGGALQGPVAHLPNALALSSLLKVQRRWSLTAAASEVGILESRFVQPDAPEPALPGPERARLNVHLEDAEWTRLALAVTADALTAFGITGTGDVLQLDPDSVSVHLSDAVAPPWPFTQGRRPQSWSLPRDSGIIASLPVTPALTAAAGRAALVTLAETHGRRVLVDLVAISSTILKGAPDAVGAKIAEIAVELASRRWSDLGTLILVAFDQPMPRLQGTRHVPDVAGALEEAAIFSMNAAGSPSVCFIVPPWAGAPENPLVAELVRFCEQTAGAGVLCCASAEGAVGLWRLGSELGDQPTLSLRDGRRFEGVDLSELAGSPVWSSSVPLRHAAEHAELPAQAPIEIALLGTVQVNGAPESFRYRRRLTELVAFLAMHPEGTTTDAFATALWPERRVPVQTLANRLSETRRALGLAGDGRPRLRKAGRRHLIADAETDWDRFKELSAPARGPEGWRKALALVRGRPFAGLERGEWAQLEGFTAAMESAIVDVASRLGEHSLSCGEAGLAHWAALQGLLSAPWDERLYRLLMRAADGMGNRGGVDAALRSLAVALELDGDPLLGIHPETSTLYRRLTSRPRM